MLDALVYGHEVAAVAKEIRELLGEERGEALVAFALKRCNEGQRPLDALRFLLRQVRAGQADRVLRLATADPAVIALETSILNDLARDLRVLSGRAWNVHTLKEIRVSVAAYLRKRFTFLTRRDAAEMVAAHVFLNGDRMGVHADKLADAIYPRIPKN